jgi:hypothetical protein
VSEETPYIDFENLPTPSEGFLVTQFITVRSVARSRAFYSDVLGGRVVLEENPCMVKLANSWVIIARLVYRSVFESIGYRQLNAFWRCQALVDLARKKQGWGTMPRRGLERPTEALPGDTVRV